jgi:hypothetical protein
MPVKPTLFCTLLVVLLSGCAARQGSERVQWRVTELSTLRAGRFSSLLDVGDSLLAVTSDLESASLNITRIPFGQDGLETESRRTTYTDKIDSAPTHAPDFGEFACAVVGSVPHVLYFDQSTEEKGILKWLSGQAGESWVIDTLEPAGLPVAVISDGQGNPISFWAAGATASMSAPASGPPWPRTDGLLESQVGGDGAPHPVLEPFSAAAPGCPAGDGFTVYDRSSRKLFFISLEEGGVRIRQVPGGREIHSSTLGDSGSLAVATYVPETRRIMLLQQTAGSDSVTTRVVTLSEKTQCLYLRQYASGYIFLYDSLERLGGKQSFYSLFLLVPEGSRYERFTLLVGGEPITGLSAVLMENTLYVLAVQETPKLITVSFNLK